MVANIITGWDIGGAHLKVARIDASGRLLYADQFAVPLWRGLQELEQALEGVRDLLGTTESRHAVTMTGELADCFSDRRSGVLSILECFGRYFRKDSTRVYAGEAGFTGIDTAYELHGQIASANWLATTEYLAGLYRNGLLVDIGSTTTDVIPFRGGVPCHTGDTDHRRMQTGELVYTGIVRTPVMAVVNHVPFRSRWQSVAAENFATMADVYRLTGQLDERHDLADTVDGRGKTQKDSARRLARMVGLDLDETIPWEAWLELAAYIAEKQTGMIAESIEQVSSQHGFETDTLLVSAGCGRFLAPALAEMTGCRHENFAAHLDTDPALRGPASDNATAVSVAMLALRERET